MDITSHTSSLSSGYNSCFISRRFREFKSLSGDLLPWVRFVVGFLRSFRQMHWYNAILGHSCFLPHPLQFTFTNYFIIRHYIIWAIEINLQSVKWHSSKLSSELNHLSSIIVQILRSEMVTTLPTDSSASSLSLRVSAFYDRSFPNWITCAFLVSFIPPAFLAHRIPDFSFVGMNN